MRRRVPIWVTVTLIALVAAGGAVIGHLLVSDSENSPNGTFERVISKVPAPPALPAFNPADDWRDLPEPVEPAAEERNESGEAYVPPPEEVSGSGGGEEGRPHGITFGR